MLSIKGCSQKLHLTKASEQYCPLLRWYVQFKHITPSSLIKFNPRVWPFGNMVALICWQVNTSDFHKHQDYIFSWLLTHWGRTTHICVGKLTIIGSDNGLSPGRRQAIIWTNAGILLIGPLETNFSEILIWIQTFSFRKMHLEISSAKWLPFCLDLNELSMYHDTIKLFSWCKPTGCFTTATHHNRARQSSLL